MLQRAHRRPARPVDRTDKRSIQYNILKREVDTNRQADGLLQR